ncbi:hypothetical protein GCM10017784_39220 [Deinococcus indicus]|uniref:hypothetical protein n=1 Tax=Deinococcus indicus TaxID=223556 RepID=UPI00174C70B2|nr:hypothetical protein [Deinococcus indicus]GHG40532.1 hypothetical protein GCM10017784_39220 [Deinococcus indicus]
MDRATRWHLGLPQPRTTHPPTETLLFDPAVREHIVRGLHTPGRWSGGALYGTAVSGILHVRHVSPLHPPTPDIRDPLTINLPYLVGVSQAVTSLMGENVQWCGQWLSPPHHQLPVEDQDLIHLTHCAKRGLVDEWHPLIMIGYIAEHLAGRAYTWRNGTARRIAPGLGPIPIPTPEDDLADVQPLEMSARPPNW